MCLIKNGRIVKYFLTERLTSIKHDKNVHLDILKNIINRYRIDAIATNCNIYPLISNQVFLGNFPSIYYYDNKHHICHASLAYYNSAFHDALVLSIDGMGSVVKLSKEHPDDPAKTLVEAESIYFFSKNKQELLYKNLTRNLNYRGYLNDLSTEVDQSINLSKYDFKNKIGIGQVYELAAIVTGNTELDCGKPMGLSSYGEYDEQFDGMYKESNTLNNGFFCRDDIIDFLFNPAKEITKTNYKKYANFCHAVQHQTQEVVGDLIEEYIETVPTNNVCLSGGYAMNVVANHYLLKRFPNLNFYFEPLCGDSGNSIGAAMNLYNRLRKWYHPKLSPNKTTSFHGNSYRISKEGNDTNLKEVSKLLYSNNSVGVFNGKAEAGQRALGNRSILFNALNPNGKEIVNSIKKREWYRPFAAIVLEEDASLYFDVSLMPSSPFMTVAFPVVTDLIPSVTHVDNTCRIQTVTNKDGYLYKLLREFKKLSGHGILLNTSMNLAGQPLVETPEDAIKMLNSSELEYLYFPQTNQIFTNDSLF
jgi:carbamoyltransferase